MGILPAVDVGKSVSRVGGKAQLASYRAVAGDLKLAYAQFEELETFARFGARMDEDTQASIDHGERIRFCLKQAESSPVGLSEQITILVALTEKLFDVIPMEKMKDAEQAVLLSAANLNKDLCDRLLKGKKLSDDDRKNIRETARLALTFFLPENDKQTTL